MIPSRRQGRPPRAPSSQAGRMKHLARKRRFEGRFGLFLACIEVFMAVRLVLADSSVIDVSDIPIIGLGAEKTDAEGLGKDAGMIPASIGSEKCSVASGSNILDASACSRFVASAGFTSEQLGFGDGCGVGNAVAEEVQASTIVSDASRVADDPSFSLGSPFEASLKDGSPDLTLSSPFEASLKHGSADLTFDAAVGGNSLSIEEVIDHGRVDISEPVVGGKSLNIDEVTDDGSMDMSEIMVDRRRGKKPLKLGGFVDLDPELVSRVSNAFENPLETKDEWVRGRFDAWRMHVAKPIDVKIEDLELDNLADNLEEFMLCVRRIDGKPYPPDSLQNLFRGFNRILRRAQDARIMNTRKEERVIDIYKDVRFMKARKALEIAMQDSAAGGFTPKRKKSDILSREDQSRILLHPAHQVTSNVGLQKRFAFYCMSRFLIRGGKELCKVRDFQFFVGRDFVDEYLEYCETTSKNWHGGINKCKPEDFREPVRCYEADVIGCWKQLEFHLPKCEVKDKFGGRFVFLQSINRPRKDVWYNTNHVSSKTMSTWLKDMVEICGINGHFTNKSCRSTAITQMSVSGVPIEVGMKITGHKDPQSYQRYDQSGVVAKASAMDVLNSGKTYGESFHNNVKNLSAGLCGNAEKAAGLSSSFGSRPLCDISNTLQAVSASSGSQGLCVPVEIDDAYMDDFDMVLKEKPTLKKYFRDPVENVVASGSVSISGNKIENLVIHVATLSEAGSVLKSLK